MADINSELLSRHRAPAGQSSGRAPAASPDPHLLTFVELLFFAYRDFTREADAVLAEFGLGRAHHRVLHFVNRHPGLRVADLLEILKITKQSLARVLKQLVDQGWIVQKAGERDRRQRLLLCDREGRGACRRASTACRPSAWRRRWPRPAPATMASRARFLFNMITKEERALVEALLPEPIEAAAASRASDRRHNGRADGHGHATRQRRAYPGRRRRPAHPRPAGALSVRATASASRTAADAASARASMRGLAFDVVILDVMMPGESGLDLARELKAISNIPICMLTARAEPEQRIEGLEAGVDDYVAKPFEPRELLLRLQNILRRGPGAVRARGTRSGWATSPSTSARGELKRKEETIKLTERERDLLRLFAQRPGMPIARHELAGDDSTGSERAIDVQINRLRRKIETDPANPVYLQTVRGQGLYTPHRLRTVGKEGRDTAHARSQSRWLA